MKTVISTPFPLPGETAAEFGVTKKRARWLANLMDAIREGRDVHSFVSASARGRRIHKAKKKLNGGRRRTRNL